MYKVTGLTVLAAVLVVAYSSNLGVAHYRDALGGPDPDTSGCDGAKGMARKPRKSAESKRHPILLAVSSWDALYYTSASGRIFFR